VSYRGRAGNSDDENSYFSDDPVDYVKPKRRFIPERINSGFAIFTIIVTSSIFVGNTLAANVVINNGRFEFGQGVARYKACSGSNNLDIKQGAQFTNEGFKLKTIEISNIPVACYELNLIVSILKPGAAGTGELATLFGSVKRLIIYDRSGTFYTSQADSSYVTLTSTNNPSTNTDTVLISFDTPSVLMTDIGTLGVESSENVLTSLPCGAGGDCEIGGLGPNGGAIIYYSDEPFTADGAPCNLACRGLEFDQTSAANYSDQWTETTGGAFVNGSVGQGVTGIGGGYANTKRAMTSANGSLGNTARTGAMAYCWNKSTSSPNDRWYLPNVMEYAHIFKQVSESAAFRSSFGGVPASTDYYTSEEAWSNWHTGYQSIWNAGSPPPGISLAISGGSPSPITERALSVEPATSSGAMVPQNFAGYAQLKIWAHPKNNGYGVICLRAFK
jgi:hypothetical protein